MGSSWIGDLVAAVRHPFSRQIHATEEPSSSARIVSPTIAQTGQSSKPPSKPRDTLPRRPIFPGACPGGKQERNGQITRTPQGSLFMAQWVLGLWLFASTEV